MIIALDPAPLLSGIVGARVSSTNEAVCSLLEGFTFYLSSKEHEKSKPAEPTEAWKRVYKRDPERKR